MSQLPTIIDIQPILNEVSVIVKNGIQDVIYNYTQSHLTRELEKCKAEMEYYKKELEILQKHNTRLNISKENISLNIEEVSDTQSDDDCTIEKILLQNEVSSKNVRVSLPESSDSGEEEEEEEEEEDQEDEEEEEETDVDEIIEDEAENVVNKVLAFRQKE